jgi:hypothetical protein
VAADAADDAAPATRFAFFGLCTGVRGHSGSAGQNASAAAATPPIASRPAAASTITRFDGRRRPAGRRGSDMRGSLARQRGGTAPAASTAASGASASAGDTGVAMPGYRPAAPFA